MDGFTKKQEARVAGSYVSRGVSPTKEDVQDAIRSLDAGIYPGAFCKIIEDSFGNPAYCNVMHADGAGTKSALAYIQYMETGDPAVFRGVAQDSIVMNLDDMACVGVTDNFVVSNTIGRNAHRVDGAVVRELIQGYEDIAHSLSSQGIRLHMAGGETADVGDLVQTVIADSTVFARLERSKVIDCSTISPGDSIVGLASFGQTAYEDRYNSGIGSNGFTAARHMLLSEHYTSRYSETYADTLLPENIYHGDFLLSDRLSGSCQTVGEALLSPTRTYLPVMRCVYAELRSGIHGVIHSSGGGQVKCKHFGRRLHYIKDNLFPPPPIFDALAATGGLTPREMYQVFNMGQRMEIYCPPTVAESVIAISEDFGVEARLIGCVAAAEGDRNKVSIISGDDSHHY